MSAELPKFAERREKKMKDRRSWFLGIAGALSAGLVTLTFGAATLQGQAAQIRWDIVSLVFGAPPIINPGGVADAKTVDNFRLRFTGSGTFVSGAGRSGGSGAATGGGEWQLYDPTNALIGSGAYVVTDVLSWEFANLFAPGPINNIGPNGANGNAVLRIEYSDGSRGILLVACHGPGAPAGISEGVAATKGFMTFDKIQPPAPGVDTNRTAFQILN
jgi:hypothetical protein